MSDRATYERWTKDQLIEHAVTTSRSRQDEALHRAALKRDLARTQSLTAAALTRIDDQLGAPVLQELVWCLSDIIEAAHPLSSSPTENTMRVTNPSSSKDEGAATRRYRRLKKTAAYRVQRVTAGLRSDLTADEAISEKRRQAACASHRARGHDHQCEYCPEESA